MKVHHVLTIRDIELANRVCVAVAVEQDLNNPYFMGIGVEGDNIVGCSFYISECSSANVTQMMLALLKCVISVYDNMESSGDRAKTISVYDSIVERMNPRANQ